MLIALIRLHPRWQEFRVFSLSISADQRGSAQISADQRGSVRISADLPFFEQIKLVLTNFPC
jgi:hypothetical protein